jgi:hypothetical protein
MCIEQKKAAELQLLTMFLAVSTMLIDYYSILDALSNRELCGWVSDTYKKQDLAGVPCRRLRAPGQTHMTNKSTILFHGIKEYDGITSFHATDVTNIHDPSDLGMPRQYVNIFLSQFLEAPV